MVYKASEERLRFIAISRHRRTQRQRAEIISALGGKCVHCGFDDPRALNIDHVNGGGTAERRRIGGGTFYKHVLARLDTQSYQLLCANCNQIKRIENKELTSRRHNFANWLPSDDLEQSRNCRNCERPFKPERSRHFFCSPACRYRYWNTPFSASD